MAASREDITFESGGKKCVGWLYRPSTPAPYPCVILAHGLGGVKHHRIDKFAERFAEEGFAALAFDYRHFGESEGEPRLLVSISRQLEDYEAAIDWARAQPEIDAKKLALWGTSFSGGHVLELAARHRHIAAVVSQCPFTDGVKDGLKMRSGWQSFRLTLAGVYDELRGLLGLSPFYVATVGPPGSLAALNRPGALEGYLAVAQSCHTGDAPERPWKPQITARSLLRIPFYRPIRRTGEITCPLLICVCESDTEVIPKSAHEAARQAEKGRSLGYPISHFAIYLGDDFTRVSQDQISFLKEALI